MKISISILTYNRANILIDLLKSLVLLSYNNVEIIVVDNCSSDHTYDAVHANFPQVKYIRMQENIGVVARNVGILKSTGDIILTLDDDIIGIDDNKIQKIIKLFQQKYAVGAICFNVRDYYTGEICNWCHHYKKEEFYEKEFITDEITEGAVAFRRKALDQTNLYPDLFFISYEGADLLCSLLRAGYITIYTPEVSVRHRHASEGRVSWRRYYYDTRNQIWFVVRNYPLFWGGKYLARGLTAMLVYSIRDGYFLYWLKAIKDAFIKLPEVLKSRNPLTDSNIKLLKKISKHRPSVIYMLKKRMFSRKVRI